MATNNAPAFGFHSKIERNVTLLLVLSLLVVTVGASLAESTANLMAPIVVNTAAQVAAQVVLDDPGLPLRAPLTVA